MSTFFTAALIGAGGAILGGAISASGAQSAASTQAQAAQNAQQISLQEFNTITAQEQPFMQAGYGAQNYLNYLMGIPGSTAPQSGGFAGGGGFGLGGLAGGFGGGGRALVGGGAPPVSGVSSAFQPPAGGPGFGSLTTPFTTANWQQLSPMYNFQLQQGQQNVLNQDATGQGALSGATLKDLINYNQSAANQSFGNAFNMYQTQQGNIFNRLSSIAQLGQNAAANTGQQGTALAGQAAQSATNIGTALAGGQVGAANAYSGALSSAIPWLYASQQTPAWASAPG